MLAARTRNPAKTHQTRPVNPQTAPTPTNQTTSPWHNHPCPPATIELTPKLAPQIPRHTHKPSKGHGFSRAKKSRAEGPTLLPQAGVKPQAQRPNCLLQHHHLTPRAPGEASRHPRRTTPI